MSSRPDERPDPDPRNEPDTDAMPGSFIDSARNMPGDQPDDDRPPPRTRAHGTESTDDDR
jgi:hypothetical protein